MNKLYIKILTALVTWTVLGLGSATAATKPHWTWLLSERKPAWGHTPNMPRDQAHPTAVQGNLVLVGCEHNGALLAIDLESGAERWRFYTNAPIRNAPIADAERIYVGSDDGYLYCLDHSGKLLWKFRGAPTERKVIGHDRLISACPTGARPVLAEGMIFFVAGCWPVDGIFVHALDAKTGKAHWTNSTAQYRPTGILRVIGKTVFVNGFSGSGAYDIATGSAVDDKVPPGEKAAAPELPGGRALIVSADRIQCVSAQDGLNREFGKPVKINDNIAADEILASSKIKDGYCLVAGLADGALVESLLLRSKLQVVALDADAAVVAKVRRRLDDAGLFNDHRLSVVHADPTTAGLPSYFASLIVSEREGPLATEWKRSQRPYGGALVERQGGKVQVTFRDGPLPGSADWGDEFGDSANTLVSRDKLVKAPLGAQWYGGVAADPKYYFDGTTDHQSGDGINPQPVGAEIVDGRMFLQSPGLLAAFDIYTGRHLWESPIPKMFAFGGPGGGLGIHSKKYPHPWKAEAALKAEVPPSQHCRASGFDFISHSDGIYVAAGPTMIRFNPIDGKRVSEWKVPLEEKDLCWGLPRVMDNLLVSTVFRPQDLIDAQAGYDGQGGEWGGDRMPMAYLVVVDRETGKLIWSRKAAWSFLNRGGVAIGAGKVFCIDLLLEGAFAKFKEAGRKFADTPPALHALDLKTGNVVWSRPLEFRAKGVVYSTKRDILVVPCRNKIEWKDGVWANAKSAKGLDALKGNMRGIRGSDGQLLWEVADEPYNDPPVLLDDLLVSRSGVTFNLQTGKRAQRTSPITGQPEEWSFAKGGCNHLIGCDGMITWRTAFYDLAGGSGSMPLKGMDAGCTPTLLPAGGLLNIPNFGTHHKRNRMTAMALIHVPENSFWGVTATQTDKAPVPAPIARAGFMFGAPGSRKSDEGTFWLPVTQKLTNGVLVQGPKVEWFELHPSRTGDWAASSGVIGASEISIPTIFSSGKVLKDPGAKRRYDVRLHFVEPKADKAGERIFSVSLEGKTVLENFDLVKEAGAPLRHVTREFKDIEIDGPLNILLSAKNGETLLTGVELIAR